MPDGIDQIERIRAMRLQVPPVQTGVPSAYPVFTQFVGGNPSRILLWIYNSSSDQLLLSPTAGVSVLQAFLLWPDQELTISLEEDPDLVTQAMYWSTRSGAVTVRWREVSTA